MLSFTDFLIEKFLRGFDYQGMYIEIWQNPTASELTQVSRPKSAWKQWQQYGKAYHYLGAWLTEKDLYVFDRDKGEHADLAGELPATVITRDSLPLYLYYFPATDACGVDVSSYSMRARIPSMTKVFERMKANRGCKAFKSYFKPH